MNRDQIIKKLEKINALAERGVGGEKETAQRMYKDLKAKYDIEDTEEILEEIKRCGFSFRSKMEETILVQTIYAVTGDTSMYNIPGVRKVFCDCTDIEAAEIKIRFAAYNAAWQKEVDLLWWAFRDTQDIYPGPDTRCNKEIPEREEEQTQEERSEQKKKAMRAAAMAFGMEKVTIPRALLETGT